MVILFELDRLLVILIMLMMFVLQSFQTLEREREIKLAKGITNSQILKIEKHAEIFFKSINIHYEFI